MIIAESVGSKAATLVRNRNFRIVIDRDASELRHASGAGFRLEGSGGRVLGKIVRDARLPVDRQAIEAEVRRLSEPSLRFLLENEVLLAGVRRPARVRAKGIHAPIVRAVFAENGWQVPPVRLWSGEGRRPPAVREGEQVIVCTAHTVSAIGGATCSNCFWLRRLGVVGRRGASQLRTRGGPIRQLRMRLRELLIELQRATPSADEFVLVDEAGRRHRGRVLPHPDCSRCSRAPILSEKADDFRRALVAVPRPVDESITRALEDPFVGPLRIHERNEAQEYPLGAPFVWGGINLTRELLGERRCISTFGGIYGKGPDLETCRFLAQSEGMERLLCLSQRPARWGEDLRGSVSAEQSIGRSEGGIRAFGVAHDLLNDSPVHLPFEDLAVGLPKALYPQARSHERFYSGAASHRTLTAAIVHGTIELIERDAFMIAWYRRRALPRIRWPKGLAGNAGALAAYLHGHHLELELFDLSLDLPLALLLLRVTARKARGNWPAGGSMLFASGAFTRPRALERILALASGQFVNLALEYETARNPLDPRAIDTMERSYPGWPLLVRYLDPRRRTAHRFLDDGRRVPFGALEATEPPAPRAMQALARGLAAAELPWFAARLTDEVAERAGFEVVKVVIPGLLRLTERRSTVRLELERMQRSWPLAQPGLHAEPHPLY